MVWLTFDTYPDLTVIGSAHRWQASHVTSCCARVGRMTPNAVHLYTGEHSGIPTGARPIRGPSRAERPVWIAKYDTAYVQTKQHAALTSGNGGPRGDRRLAERGLSGRLLSIMVARVTWEIRRYRFAGAGPVTPNSDLKNTNWSGEKFDPFLLQRCVTYGCSVKLFQVM